MEAASNLKGDKYFPGARIGVANGEKEPQWSDYEPEWIEWID